VRVMRGCSPCQGPNKRQGPNKQELGTTARRRQQMQFAANTGIEPLSPPCHPFLPPTWRPAWTELAARSQPLLQPQALAPPSHRRSPPLPAPIERHFPPRRGLLPHPPSFQSTRQTTSPQLPPLKPPTPNTHNRHCT
jgi:hypothetical protein